MSRRQPATTVRTPARRDFSAVPAKVVAALIGFGFSLLACGFVLQLEFALDASPITFRLATGALFAAMALGPRLPRWLARRVIYLLRRWWRFAPDIGLSTLAQRADRDVWWTVVSIVGLFTGVATLLMPLVISSALALYAHALQRFLWTGKSLVVCEALVMLLAALPCVAVGLFAQCAHRRSADTRQWDPVMLAWMAGGCGAGLMVAVPAGYLAARAGVLLGGGAAVMLLAAIVVVSRGGSGQQVTGTQDVRSPLREPDTGQQWPMIMRLTITVAVATTISAGLIWVYVVDALDMANDGWGPLVGGGLLLCAALGLGHAIRGHANAAYGVGAFGIRCAIAGVTIAAGVAVFNLVARASYSGFIHGPGVWLLWTICAGVPMVIAGRAIGFGVCELLVRAGHDADTGAGILQMLFGSAAVACVAIGLVLLEHLGSYAALVALSLALLATGGTLVIHQPCPKRRVHRLRLGAVFGGVVGMTFLMPSAGRHWLGHQQRVRGQLWESWWVTQDIHPTRDAAQVTQQAGHNLRVENVIDWYRVQPGCRVAVISLFGNEPLDMPGAVTPYVEQWALLADGGEAHTEVDASGAGGLTALRAMRASTERFDVLLVSLSDAPVEFITDLLRDGFAQRAWSRLAPDGLLVFACPTDEALLAALRARITESAPRDDTHPLTIDNVTLAQRAGTVAYATVRRDGAATLIARTRVDAPGSGFPEDITGAANSGSVDAFADGR